MVCCCHVGFADLTEVVVVAGYDALAEVYEWLISDAKLTPAEFAAAFDDVIRVLPSNARVLDCSCGTGQLAVGLSGLAVSDVAYACRRVHRGQSRSPALRAARKRRAP